MVIFERYSTASNPNLSTPRKRQKGGRAPMSSAPNHDNRKLVERLTALVGAEIVHGDAVALESYSRDATPLFHGLPEVVVTPRSTQEVVEIVKFAASTKTPIIARGAGSNLCAATVPLNGGIVLSMNKMNKILEVNRAQMLAVVQPGVTNQILDETVAKDGLMFVPDPGSKNVSTIGGNVATSAGGLRGLKYGTTRNYILGLEAVLGTGEVIRTGGRLVKDVAGYDVTRLLVGSEGTLAVITRVWLRAHPLPEVERRAAFVFTSFSDGIEACRRIIRAGATPAVLRLYDGTESKRSHGGDGTQCTLLVLDEGTESIVDGTMSVVFDTCKEMGAADGDVALIEAWMHHRNDTSGLQALTRKGFVVDTMEVAANWGHLDSVVEAVESAMLAVPHARSATCHLSHSYIEGACVYFTFAATPEEADFESTYLAMWKAGQEAGLTSGANLSHHHGIGYSRSQFMEQALGTSMGVLRAVKKALDPNGILNPGKLGL